MKHSILLYMVFVLIGCQGQKDSNVLPLKEDEFLDQFYQDMLESVNLPEAEFHLINYDSILVDRGFLSTMNGDSIMVLFQKMRDKEEIFLPTYGRASNCPFDLKGFLELVRKTSKNKAELKSSPLLHKIVDGHNAVEQGNDLGPKIIAQFFLDNFSKHMWENDKYRYIGHMFYFLYTTIDDVGRKEEFEKMLKEFDKNTKN